MDGLGEEFLARARLAAKQHRGRAVRRDAGMAQGLLQTGAGAQNGIKGEMGVAAGHFHGHAHGFFFFQHGEQAARHPAVAHADGIE